MFTCLIILRTQCYWFSFLLFFWHQSLGVGCSLYPSRLFYLSFRSPLRNVRTVSISILFISCTASRYPCSYARNCGAFTQQCIFLPFAIPGSQIVGQSMPVELSTWVPMPRNDNSQGFSGLSVHIRDAFLPFSWNLGANEGKVFA